MTVDETIDQLVEARGEGLGTFPEPSQEQVDATEVLVQRAFHKFTADFRRMMASTGSREWNRQWENVENTVASLFDECGLLNSDLKWYKDADSTEEKNSNRRLFFERKLRVEQIVKEILSGKYLRLF